MGKINSRTKGKTGERQLIGELKQLLPGELTDELERNLTQTRGGGHDIVGLDGWAIEVKRYAQFTPADLINCWMQALDQARRAGLKPVLCYRADRRDWRAILLAADMHPGVSDGEDYANTVDVSLPLFAAIVRYQANVQKS